MGTGPQRNTLSLNQFFPPVLGEKVEPGVTFLCLFYGFAKLSWPVLDVSVCSLYCCAVSWKSSIIFRRCQPLWVFPLMESHLSLTSPKELLGKLFIHGGGAVSNGEFPSSSSHLCLQSPLPPFRSVGRFCLFT